MTNESMGVCCASVTSEDDDVHKGTIQCSIPHLHDARLPEKVGNGGQADVPVDGDRDSATASDGALDLGCEPGREERAGQRARVVRQHNVEGAVEEREVV